MAEWWYLDFAAPGRRESHSRRRVRGRDPLSVPGRWSRPGFLCGDGRGSNTLTGNFTVLRVIFGPSDEILEFDAIFEQHSEARSRPSPAGSNIMSPHRTAISILKNDAEADGDALNPVIVSPPQHGGISLDATGYFIYTPDQDFIGTDTFQYTANDGSADGNVATVSIHVLPSISIDDVSLVEGNDGTTTMTLTVSISGPYDQDVSVHLATADGTATAGSDYESATGFLVWSVGDTSDKTFSVTVYGDTDWEPNETFFVNLTDPTGASLAKSQGLGTILNDENTSPSVTVVTPSSPQYGDIAIHYTLFDNESDACGIVVEASTDGIHWSTAPQGQGGDGTTDLAASPMGVEHTFVWKNSLNWPQNIVSGEPAYHATIRQFRITPSDAVVAGTSATTGQVTIVDYLDTTPPTPNPSGWATAPYTISGTSISMTATTAHDPDGVQYYLPLLDPRRPRQRVAK